MLDEECHIGLKALVSNVSEPAEALLFWLPGFILILDQRACLASVFIPEVRTGFTACDDPVNLLQWQRAQITKQGLTTQESNVGWSLPKVFNTLKHERALDAGAQPNM